MASSGHDGASAVRVRFGVAINSVCHCIPVMATRHPSSRSGGCPWPYLLGVSTEAVSQVTDAGQRAEALLSPRHRPSVSALTSADST